MVQSFNQPRRQGQKRVGKGRAEFGNGVTMVVTMVGGLFGSQKVFWGGRAGGSRRLGVRKEGLAKIGFEGGTRGLD